jgi:putative aldouronate transport system substrate-binding protein
MKYTVTVAIGLVLVAGLCFAAGSEEDEDRDQVGFNATGLPIVNEPVTLRFAVAKAPVHGDFEELPVIERLRTDTNVIIDWQEIPGSGFQEAKNLMFASGDLPDAFSGSGLTDSDIMRYGPEGFLIPLEGMIEEYGVHIPDLFSELPEVETMLTAPDGHMYSLPFVEDLDFLRAPQSLLINREWLGRLDLSMPTTTEEFREVLIAFRDQDPNGNGESDEIPFSFQAGDHRRGLFALYGAWGVMDTLDYIMVENDQVKFSRAEPGFRDGTAFFHELYEDGLIDEEAFTQDFTRFRAKGEQSDAVYGAFMGWTGAEVGNERGRDMYMTNPPLEGPNGTRMWRAATPNQTGFRRNYFSITSANAFPEATLRWVDQIFEHETAIEISYGTVGVTIDRTDDGKWVRNTPPAGMSPYEFRNRNSMWNAVPNIIRDTYFENLDYSNDWGFQRKMDDIALYGPYLFPQVYPSVWFDRDTSEELAVLRTDINTFVEQKQAEWIVDGGVEEEWDAYLDQLDRMGLPRLLEILQDRYDEYYSN